MNVIKSTFLHSKTFCRIKTRTYLYNHRMEGCHSGEQKYRNITAISRHDRTEFEYERNWTSFHCETVLGRYTRHYVT